MAHLKILKLKTRSSILSLHAATRCSAGWSRSRGGIGGLGYVAASEVAIRIEIGHGNLLGTISGGAWVGATEVQYAEKDCTDHHCQHKQSYWSQ